MSSPLAQSPTRNPDRDLAPETRTRTAERPTSHVQPAQSGRWWFVFDRWLAVSGAAEAQDEFVLA
jgi:hypothetical protein